MVLSNDTFFSIFMQIYIFIVIVFTQIYFPKSSVHQSIFNFKLCFDGDIYFKLMQVKLCTLGSHMCKTGSICHLKCAGYGSV